MIPIIYSENHRRFYKEDRSRFDAACFRFDGVDERHWMPGKGIVDWNDVIAALVEVGYEGPFTFELSTKTQRDIHS